VVYELGVGAKLFFDKNLRKSLFLAWKKKTKTKQIAN
jgi:hypothetical protein